MLSIAKLFLLSVFALLVLINNACADFSSDWESVCDNLGDCSAIGYTIAPNDPPDIPNDSLYITAKWKKGSDIINFAFSDSFPSSDYKKNITASDIKLCDNSKKCRVLDHNDHFTFSIDPSDNDTTVNVEFTLDTKHMTKASYIISYRERPVYFKELLENLNPKGDDYEAKLGGKEKIYKIKSIESLDQLTDAEWTKLYPQYMADIKGDSSGNGYKVEYANGDKFIFAGLNGGFDTRIGKYNGKFYEDFNAVDDASFSIMGDSGLGSSKYNNSFYLSLNINENNKITFSLNTPSPSAYVYGDSYEYDMAYNGKYFIIETIYTMPIYTFGVDWLRVYQRPS